MIDLKFLRENPEIVKQNIKNKFQDKKLPLVDEVIALDEEARAAKQEADDLRASRNKLSKQIGALMGQGKKDEAEALKAISTSDKERGNHYFRYTDQKWGKAQNYDICINSALMGIEKTAEMLTAMAKIEVRA